MSHHSHPMNRWLKVSAAAAMIALLGGCLTPPARPPISHISQLRNHETVVVGRVEIVPPLDKADAELTKMFWTRYNNKMFLIIDDTPRRLTDEPGLFDFSGRIEAEIGRTFAVRSSNKPFYILAGMMLLNQGDGTGERTYFPAGLKVDIHPEDKAVYIGTIRYHRNEYMDIERLVIEDAYEKTAVEVKKRLGVSRGLTKRLALPLGKKTARTGR